MTTIYRAPHNYVPENDYGPEFWMQRIPTPIWRHCIKGAHGAPTPFHVEVEGRIGSMEPLAVLWACSWCGYRYAPGYEPEAMPRDWHERLLQETFGIEEDVDAVLSPDVSLTALHIWGAELHRDEDDES